MLVCSVVQRPRRHTVTAGVVEVAGALDNPGLATIFATLSDAPGNARDLLDAFNGQRIVEATNAAAAQDASLAALSISGTPVTAARVGIVYAGFTVTAAGGAAPYSYSVASGTLPAGITLNASSGAVSGTPTTAGTYASIIIRATDAVSATANLAAFTITVAVAALPATFDPATTVNATLSNGNLTATHSNTAANSGARGMSAMGSGKFYFELTILSGVSIVGLCTPATTYATVASGSASTTALYNSQNGAVNVAGSFIGGIGGTSANDVIGVAVDFTAGLAWIRRQGGNWNGSGTANPATGTGGAAFTAGMAMMPVVAFGTGGSESWTLNLGATAYASAAPSGFGNWPSDDFTAPTITSSASVSNNENVPLALSLTANETVTWSIIGGADAAKFEISGATLRWLSNGTKNYEAPDDADANNQYIVQVRATDSNANTTDQTITVTVADVAVETWNPGALGADLWAWWKFDEMSQANGVAVASVADSSGNGRTLTLVGSPTAKAAAQNGLKSLDFSATTSYGTFASSTALTSGSFFAVNKAGASPSGTTFGGVCDMGSDSQTNHYTYAGQVYCDFLSTFRKTAGAVTVNVWHQVLFWSAASDWGHGMDGTDKYTTTSNAVFGRATSYLASDNQFGTWRHQGEFGEVVILNNKPTTLNRQKLEGYLAWKWGIQASLPGGHPYKSAPP